MTETDIKFLTAIIAAVGALVVAVITHFSSRSNQREIELLRSSNEFSRDEKNARREYEFDARKRLYQECGPILFQLSETCEASFYRILGLAKTTRDGNMERFMKDEYYKLSTLYRLLSPSAVLKVLQRKLTLVDLSLDRTIFIQYSLARQAFLAFGDEFMFAQIDPPLRYLPFDSGASSLSLTDPATYERQGLPLGVMETAIEALIVREGEETRILTYAECETEYSKSNSRIRETFDSIMFLIDGFNPQARPVFWRIIVAQACIYRVLSQPRDLERENWNRYDLQLPEEIEKEFDWRSSSEQEIDFSVIKGPIKVAQEYFERRLGNRLGHSPRI